MFLSLSVLGECAKCILSVRLEHKKKFFIVIFSKIHILNTSHTTVPSSEVCLLRQMAVVFQRFPANHYPAVHVHQRFQVEGRGCRCGSVCNCEVQGSVHSTAYRQWFHFYTNKLPLKQTYLISYVIPLFISLWMRPWEPKIKKKCNELKSLCRRCTFCQQYFNHI
jgi:hypothetical protein